MNKLIQTFSNPIVQKIGLFLLGCLLYINTIPNEYAQDDAIVITENMFVEKGVQGIPDLLKTDAFYGFFKQDGKSNLVQGGRYRPLSLITFAFEKSIFGKNPHVSHGINMLLYGTICLLLFLLLKTLLPDSKWSTLIWITVILFTTHPIHSEAVANIKGRDELFVGLFGLASAWLFVKSLNNKSLLIASYIAFIGALFSKEHAIVWTILIPLMVYYFLPKNTWKKLSLRYIPFLFFTIAFLFIRARIVGGGIGAPSMEWMNNPFLKFDGSKMVPMTFMEENAMILKGLFQYIKLLFIPYPLTNDYYPQQLGVATFTDTSVILAILLYIGMIGLSIWGLFKKHIIGFACSFYLIALFLMSNIPFSIGTHISERFLFLPSIGFALFIAYILSKYISNIRISGMITAVIACIFCGITINRNTVWKNDFTLLSTDVHVSKNSAKSLHAAGGALTDRASSMEDGPQKLKMLQEAQTYLDRCLQIYPLYYNAYLIKGNNYFYQNEYDKALEVYEKLIKLNPNFDLVYENLRNVLRAGGRYFGEQEGNLKKANEWLKKAYQYNPKDYETLRLLGTSYGMLQDNEQALKYFLKATEVNPNEGYAWFNVSIVYNHMGDKEKANFYLQKAIALDPSLKQK